MCDCIFIAEIHHSAKVWVSYGKYTISESHSESGILHLRYENDIPIISRYSRIVVRWYHRFCIRFYNHNILYRPPIEKIWNCNVSPRF